MRIFTIALALLAIHFFPPLTPVSLGQGAKARCRAPGVPPQGKNPLASCDPVKDRAIVTKRQYDRAEDEYNYSKEKVERAEKRLVAARNDPEASKASQERARLDMLRARAQHQAIKESGRKKAEEYKDAEEAMRREKGYYLDRKSFDDATEALKLAAVEDGYNKGMRQAAAGGEYGRNFDAKGNPLLDHRGVPQIGAGGFKGGSNTQARPKARAGKDNAPRRKYQNDPQKSKGYKTGYDAGWEDGGGDWNELGGEGKDKGAAASPKRFIGQERGGGSGSAGISNSAYSAKLEPTGQRSLGLVTHGDGSGLALASAEASVSKSIGGPGMTLLREAEAYLSQGDYKNAVRSADFAARRDPDNASAYLMKARALNRAGDHEAAAKAAIKALRKDPKNGKAAQELAWAQLHMGDYKSSIEMASLAIKLDPHNAEAYMIRAFAYEQLGMRDLMLADLEHAAGLNSKFQPHLQHAKNGGKLFDPTSKTTLSLLTGTPAFAMMQGKDPVKMSMFFLSALAIGIFAVLQFRRKASTQTV